MLRKIGGILGFLRLQNLRGVNSHISLLFILGKIVKPEQKKQGLGFYKQVVYTVPTCLKSGEFHELEKIGFSIR